MKPKKELKEIWRWNKLSQKLHTEIIIYKKQGENFLRIFTQRKLSILINYLIY